MRLLNRILSALTSPVFIGLSVTMAFLLMTHFYFLQKDIKDDESKNLIAKSFEWLDQKSADIRMRSRGIKAPIDSPVAILSIDDQSIEEVGRWPWSRLEMAKLIETMMENGAKVIGFDMIFSEPEREIGADAQFAKVIQKYQDKLVLGSYYEHLGVELAPYQDICYHQAVQNFSFFLAYENMSRPLKVDDPEDHYNKIGGGLLPVFEPLFEGIAEAAREDFIAKELSHKSPDEWTHQDRVRAHRASNEALLAYCNRWLNAEKDEGYEFYSEYWSEFLGEISPEFIKENFDQSKSHLISNIPENAIRQVGRWWINISELNDVTKHTAFFNAELDSDGTIRRKPLVYRSGAHYIPSLALQSYLVGTNSSATIRLERKKDNFNSHPKKVISELLIMDSEGNKRFSVPVDETGSLSINYAGPQKMYPYLRASELLNDKETALISKRVLNPETGEYEIHEEYVDKKIFIKDRIFVLGATAVGVYDLRVTPFEENYPGVETHASIIDNLIQQNFLKSHPNEYQYMMAALAVFGLFVTLGTAYTGAFIGLLLSTLALTLIYLVDYYFIYGKGYQSSIPIPLLLVFSTYFVMTFYKYFTEERKKKHLRSTFSKYVSPAIVDEILKDPTNVELGGKKTHMTVFFSDVRGFTTISEKLDPVALSKLLSDYLTPMTEIVFNNKGTLDKYMGDAVMAFFGAPVHFEDHAKHACRCALQSLEKTKELQKTFEAQGLPKIDIGIGLNSAEMSVGNMGSNIVRNYTVMGDAVNLGSRLEGINKEYGTRIIISEFTYRDIKDEFTTREIDWVRVKGKTEPIRIYELICEGQPDQQTAKMLWHFAKGFRHYHNSKFSDALDEFNKALEIMPEDGPSKLYVERCQEYLSTPPATDWDGVYVMTTK